VIRADKRGDIDESAYPILQQLGIEGHDRLEVTQNFGKKYHQVVV
tara:strand:- start:437 stop:571 length:135 start_codon:yes stop_codon:yes gene_type:complete